jgi:serine/threonine-protein kinase
MLLLDRYRIIGLLGRGGMGEVYRADDLRLGQAVALKFLPPDLASDPVRLARFHNEVRLARQVSHPNVCRVHDIGDVDGQPFLSMEYVDGEDLSSLLRRIGRLPKDKAVEIARQICAGLASAHEQGVLHRDLKPSNVMLDGRGRARLADFGLAAVAGEDESPGNRAGTPAYMAPEVLAGGEAGVRSDLYALGLVLYELFTGKRVFEGKTLAELLHQHEAVDPTPPSQVVEDFDPVVERVILRCLEKDPRMRPASAMAVASALPGGDPLAMALLAGETPSPEMVAAAGEVGVLRPAVAWRWLAGVVVAIAVAVWLGGAGSLIRWASAPKPPDILIDRAQTILRTAGYPDPPADFAINFGYHRTWLEHVRDTVGGPGWWTRLSQPNPPAFFLFYRQSPRQLLPKNVTGAVDSDDPAADLPGMAALQITGSGDLWQLAVVPPQVEEPGDAAPPPDWAPLFKEAGLDLDRFRPVTPRWVPADYADVRAAWDGEHPAVPGTPLRIEAAAYRGRAVYFQVLWPWNRPLRARPFEPTIAERVGNGIVIALLFAGLAGGLLMARLHLRAGRGDRRGAVRLALVVFIATLVGTAAHAAHVPRIAEEWSLLVRLFGAALFQGASVWIYYLALEPLVRRRWPDMMIGWTRLLAGRSRDPLVGRDLLIGMLLGAIGAIVSALRFIGPGLIGATPPLPSIPELNAFEGPGAWVATLLDQLTTAIIQATLMLFLLVQLRTWLKRERVATIAFLLVLVTVQFLTLSSNATLLTGAVVVLQSVILTVALARYGVLTLTATLLCSSVLTSFPIVFTFRAWYASAGLFALVVLTGVTLHALRSALAGRSILEVQALDR